MSVETEANNSAIEIMKQQFSFCRLLNIPKGCPAWKKVAMPGSITSDIPRPYIESDGEAPLLLATDVLKFGHSFTEFTVNRSFIKRQRRHCTNIYIPASSVALVGGFGRSCHFRPWDRCRDQAMGGTSAK